FEGNGVEGKGAGLVVPRLSKFDIFASFYLLEKTLLKFSQAFASLNDKCLVKILHCTFTPTHIQLVMEYCNGGNLASYLERKGTLNEYNIRHFASQIARGISVLHKNGIVHGDLKPQNVLLHNTTRMMDPLACNLLVKISDFGMTRLLPEDVVTNMCCKYPQYMAPEMIVSQQYNEKVDLWSIGTIVYECLVGKPPFQVDIGPNLKAFYCNSCDLHPEIPDHCSESLRDFLIRLLKRNAEDRISCCYFNSESF
ncbi:hypothetical protein PENTCL1PPCAC_10525, partial [Pristionchus entomophagus]